MILNLSCDKNPPIHYMISHKNLSCDEVAMHLCNIGIPGTVTSQFTINCDKSKTNCQIENGCLLTIYNTSLKNFYKNVVFPLTTKNSLTCGYVNIDGVYTGCVNNLFRSSNCN